MLGLGVGFYRLGGDTKPDIWSTTTALGLDGNSDYVELPSGFKSNFDTGTGSVSLWINLVENDGGTSQTAFRIETDSNNFLLLLYHKHYTEWRASIKTGGTIRTATYDIPGSSNNDGSGYDDGWQHFVITFHIADGAYSIRLYRNGSLVQNTNGSSGQSDWSGEPASAYIGAQGGTSAFIDGYIDQLAFYNVELTAANITAMYNSGVPRDLTTIHTNYSPANLYAYYQFENNALDSSLNGYHATLNGTASVNNKVQPDD